MTYLYCIALALSVTTILKATSSGQNFLLFIDLEILAGLDEGGACIIASFPLFSVSSVFSKIQQVEMETSTPPLALMSLVPR